MLAMIMRFVPYIGALISAIFPLILAAAVGSGWTMFLITAVLFIVAETVVGQAIEPLVTGKHWTFACSDNRLCNLLDMVVGTGRVDTCDTVIDVPGRGRPTCRSA